MRAAPPPTTTPTPPCSKCKSKTKSRVPSRVLVLIPVTYHPYGFIHLEALPSTNRQSRKPNVCQRLRCNVHPARCCQCWELGVSRLHAEDEG